MTATRGFFSIIQFCPDLDRLETANVGIVLAVPELRFVGVRLSDNNEGPKQHFGADSFDDGRLTLSKRSMEARLKLEGADWVVADDLLNTSRKEANHLRLSLPRTILVRDAVRTLEDLYQNLVHVERRARRRVEKPDLSAVFEPGLIGVPLHRNYELTLPAGYGVQRFPYAYQNGKLNLVLPESFPYDDSAARKHAESLAVRGHLIHKKSHPGKEQQLIVVANFAETTSGETKHNLETLLKENDARLIDAVELPAFVEEIRKTAH